MVERGNLLDGNLLTRRLVNGRAGRRIRILSCLERSSAAKGNIPNYTVSALTDHILNVVLFADIERDLA